MATMPVRDLSKPGFLKREFLGIARFLVDLEAVRGWGVALEPGLEQPGTAPASGDRVA